MQEKQKARAANGIAPRMEFFVKDKRMQ